MPSLLYERSSVDADIYKDLQKIIRIGMYRFRREHLKALPRAAGYPESAREDAVRGAIRKLIREQIDFLPDEQQEFAELLFGLTDDTSNQPVSVRERLAGEALEQPLYSSTIRSKGGMREVVILSLAQRICEWADHYNPAWRHGGISPLLIPKELTRLQELRRRPELPRLPIDQ
jgi:hypothetical protein